MITIFIFFCKSNIPNLIAGSRNMTKVSKNVSFFKFVGEIQQLVWKRSQKNN